jgi:TolA-binding protein
MLHFYSDYAHDRSGELWWVLFRDFGSAPESAEARWRIARLLAGRGRFSQAGTYLDQAQTMVQQQLDQRPEDAGVSESLYSAFRPPAETVMTPVKLRELQGRIQELQTLIGEENRAGEEGAADRLARFVALNPHSLDYAGQLEALLATVGPTDGLRDNIMLALATLIPDDERRAERLIQLNEEFQDTDGGMRALYELTLLKIGLYQREDESDQAKRKLLTDARETLANFLTLYPNSLYVDRVKRNLDALPKPE